MKNIPSDKDFAQASKHMEERSRGLAKVRENIIQQFKDICPIHDFYILDQRDVDFRAFIFFKNNSDIKLCRNNGTLQDLMNQIYAELEKAGRGRRDNIKVAFEIDSDENVLANFEGDYFLRLR